MQPRASKASAGISVVLEATCVAQPTRAASPEHPVFARISKCKIGEHSLGPSRMLSPDGSPLLTLVVGVFAALPAYALTRRTGRGRARGAIAYLCGLAMGLTVGVLLFQMLHTLAWNVSFGSAALAGAFFGPFAGLAWGIWVRSGRRKRRRTITSGEPV